MDEFEFISIINRCSALSSDFADKNLNTLREISVDQYEFVLRILSYGLLRKHRDDLNLIMTLLQLSERLKSFRESIMERVKKVPKIYDLFLAINHIDSVLDSNNIEDIKIKSQLSKLNPVFPLLSHKKNHEDEIDAFMIRERCLNMIRILGAAKINENELKYCTDELLIKLRKIQQEKQRQAEKQEVEKNIEFDHNAPFTENYRYDSRGALTGAYRSEPHPHRQRNNAAFPENIASKSARWSRGVSFRADSNNRVNDRGGVTEETEQLLRMQLQGDPLKNNFYPYDYESPQDARRRSILLDRPDRVNQRHQSPPSRQSREKRGSSLCRMMGRLCRKSQEPDKNIENKPIEVQKQKPVNEDLLYTFETGEEGNKFVVTIQKQTTN